MTDHEPSYYEIALTNRQVVVAFVILLACLMGTFFAGVWVGGGDAPQAAAEVPAAGEQAVADEQPIEELDFFGGGGEVAPPQGDRTEVRYEEPGPGEGGSEPPREDPAVQRNRREARAAAARAAREDAADTAGGEGAALSQDAPTAQPQQQADTRTETMEPIRETAPPTTTRPQPRQDSSGDLVVQVFSSRERDQAQKVVDTLTGAGQRAFLSPQEVDGRTMYRVRIGPFSDRADAEKVAAQVKRTHRLDTWITQ